MSLSGLPGTKAIDFCKIFNEEEEKAVKQFAFLSRNRNESRTFGNVSAGIRQSSSYGKS